MSLGARGFGRNGQEKQEGTRGTRLTEWLSGGYDPVNPEILSKLIDEVQEYGVIRSIWGAAA